MNRRRAERTKKRLACSLQIEGRHHSGVVLDVSATGLFVQTNAKPEAGTPVSLEMSMPGSQRPLFFQAVVARQVIVPPQLVTVAKGGLGLLIQNAPEDWYAFVADVLPSQTEAVSAASSAPAAGSKPESAARGKAGVAKPKASKRAASGRSIVEKSNPQKKRPKRGTASLIRFRVRMSQVAGSRSRSVIVSATSEAEARRLATEEAGDGWKIVECEPATAPKL